MESSSVVFSPTVLCFTAIVLGSLLGKIKIKSFSLDISAVLIVSVLIGVFISKLNGFDSNSEFANDMSLFSKFGTAIFISAIGIMAGDTVAKGIGREDVFAAAIGSLMVLASLLFAVGIGVSDFGISKSALLGVVCGSMTSTPALTAICENEALISGEIILGYGTTYFFGIVGVVLFVQILVKEYESKSGRLNIASEYKELNNTYTLILMGISVVLGSVFGGIRIFNASTGATGGILLASMLIGFLSKRVLKKSDFSNLYVYRNLGLMLFFVGNGIPAGMRLTAGTSLKWFIYGVLITSCVCSFGYCFSRAVFGFNKEKSLFVVSGGMTSTPAVAVISNRCGDGSLSLYSFSYFGALITMVFGIRILGFWI